MKGAGSSPGVQWPALPPPPRAQKPGLLPGGGRLRCFTASVAGVPASVAGVPRARSHLPYSDRLRGQKKDPAAQRTRSAAPPSAPWPHHVLGSLTFFTPVLPFFGDGVKGAEHYEWLLGLGMWPMIVGVIYGELAVCQAQCF